MSRLIIFTTTIILSIIFVLPILMLVPIKMVPSSDQPGYEWTHNISIYGERKIRQEFVSIDKNMMAIGTSIRNLNLKNKKEIILNLYDENNNLVRTSVLNGFNIGDGDFVKFIFEPITDSKNKKYYLEISSPTAGEEEIIRLFITDSTEVVKNYTYDKNTYEGGIPLVTFHKPDSLSKSVKVVFRGLLSKF